MKKILVLVVIFLTVFTGCSNSLKPIKVIKVDFDLLQAENIMKKAWKPVHQITNSRFDTKPDMEISSKEEFFNIYDFTLMDDRIKSDLYEDIVDIGEDGIEIKDSNGNLVFGKQNYIFYIPTIHDEGVYIKNAYIKESVYEEEYSSENKVELVIMEQSNQKINENATGFHRTNIFKKNEEGKWILNEIEGIIAIEWDKHN